MYITTLLMMVCCSCRETLRLSPVVSGLAAEAAQDLQLGEYAVPAGTSMSIAFVELAKNDPRWLDDEPEKFRQVLSVIQSCNACRKHLK
jgi:hypothetical protein